MNTIKVALQIPEYVAQGLSSGIYERAGGVIRKTTGSKEIVTWLREVGQASESAASSILSLSSVGAVASVLNLAVSTMGFIVVLNRIGVIEQRLELAQENLLTIDSKLDLSFYANFRAALDLANNAFTMTNADTRKISATQAVNRFLEAEHHYTKLTDMEIGNGSQVAVEYLSTLCLAYVAEARCYLELEEIDTAHRRLQEGATILRSRFKKYINTLLTSNPAAYLHPAIKGQVGLNRLTRVYQWLEPGITASDVFEMQRENLFKLAQNPQEWVNTLPQAIFGSKSGTAAPTNMLNDIAKRSKKLMDALPSMSRTKDGSPETVKLSPDVEAYARLPIIMDSIEAMIEDDNRLAVYELEVETIHRLGMGFQEWLQLAPSSSSQKNETNLMYITIS